MEGTILGLNGKTVPGKASVKVTKMTFSHGVTRNAGNYESIRVEEGIEVTVQGSVNLEAVIKTAREQLRIKVNEAAKAALENLKSQR